MASMLADDIAKVMADAMFERIRDNLRAQILEKIEPDIQASIDAVMETFKARVAVWKDYAQDELVVKFLIEDRRENKK
jgi:hypothetical protein